MPQGVANIARALSSAGVVWRAGAPWRISIARSGRLWGRPRDAPAARGPPSALSGRPLVWPRACARALLLVALPHPFWRAPAVRRSPLGSYRPWPGAPVDALAGRGRAPWGAENAGGEKLIFFWVGQERRSKLKKKLGDRGERSTFASGVNLIPWRSLGARKREVHVCLQSEPIALAGGAWK